MEGPQETLLQQLLSLPGTATIEDVRLIINPHGTCQKGRERFFTGVLSELAREQRAYLAVQVLNSLIDCSLEINIFHYGAAISACEKGGQWQQSLNLLTCIVSFELSELSAH